MKILGHICAGHTLFLTFSVFKASLVIGGASAKEFQPHFRCGRVKRARIRIITLRFTFRVTPRLARSCWEHRGCASRGIGFGHRQNTRMGWSDPTFGHDSVAKVRLGVAPAHEEIPSDVLPACFAEFLDEKCVGNG